MARLIDGRDVHTYGGIVCVTTGLAFIYWPAALVAFGCAVFYLGERMR